MQNPYERINWKDCVAQDHTRPSTSVLRCLEDVYTTWEG